LDVEVFEETRDTEPNRFVKHALKSWLAECSSLREVISAGRASVVRDRALREIDEVSSALEESYFSEWLHEVQESEEVPFQSTVLQERDGYRDFLSLYLVIQLSSQITWETARPVFAAGQKNVAYLFELWCMFQLIDSVREVCDESDAAARLFEVQGQEIKLRIASSSEAVFEGHVVRSGQRLKLSLFYNRSFAASGGSSWTLRMRPDFSVRIGFEQVGPRIESEVWIHFDAKYRIDSVAALVGAEEDAISSEMTDEPLRLDERESRSARREDLLRMHAYKDAIARTEGSFVLYPGNDEKTFQEYHELLPGLGAFPLAPSDLGVAVGQSVLRRFIADVLTHLADQASQHDRYRYWREETFGLAPVSSSRYRPVPFLKRPPADAYVLLGYVKSAAHLSWTVANGLYNLRADDRRGGVGLDSTELDVAHVLLYGDSMSRAKLFEVRGGPRLVSSAELLASGYPAPRGRQYLCLSGAVIEDKWWGDAISCARIQTALRRARPDTPRGAPTSVRWLDLLGWLSAD
jgi:hypothetical protein